jgi:hypothetical protein
MTTGAENGGIRQDRLHGAGIVGMLRLRAVAGFAINASVFTGFFELENVLVANFAGLMASVDDRQSGDFGDGIAAVVAVFAEALRHEPGAEAEKEGDSYEEDGGDPDEVFRVLKSIHSWMGSGISRPTRRKAGFGGFFCIEPGPGRR